MHYYNENDPKIAKWLTNLIEAGMLPDGHVDTRSIEQVEASDLDGYSQHHFFAGIGGWPLALKMAGWPENQPVWTGSCPCQPFSVAGKQKGINDERHLWPIWGDLIAQRNPPVIFGEQVASPDGRNWLADVRNSLEALDYAVGAADLCAASVGAPHIRQRLYWVGYSEREGLERLSRYGNDIGRRKEKNRPVTETNGEGGMADSPSKRCEGQRLLVLEGGQVESILQTTWTDEVVYIECEFDGKFRPTKPGIPLLVDGVSNRVAKLHGIGNAIVPPLAAIFIKSFIECL